MNDKTGGRWGPRAGIRGQTIALLEFPPSTGSPTAVGGVQVPASSDIRQDLTLFDSMFGLPPRVCKL